MESERDMNDRSQKGMSFAWQFSIGHVITLIGMLGGLFYLTASLSAQIGTVLQKLQELELAVANIPRLSTEVTQLSRRVDQHDERLNALKERATLLERALHAGNPSLPSQ
jgi:hypothetical protein